MSVKLNKFEKQHILDLVKNSVETTEWYIETYVWDPDVGLSREDYEHTLEFKKNLLAKLEENWTYEEEVVTRSVSRKIK